MHLIVVEAYAGLLDCAGGDAGGQAAEGLGLPLPEIAAQLATPITVLDWDEWLDYEATSGSFQQWVQFPATRLRYAPGAPRRSSSTDAQVRRRSIPAADPDTGRPLSEGLSPRTHGLLANSDPYFLLSYCLHRYLQQLHQTDPFAVVVLPVFGGLGYVAQLAQATGVDSLRGVAFATVMSGSSLVRQEANGEGLWTRPAVTRRQMEDLSLALAGQVFHFGPLGAGIVQRGRLPEAPASVEAPRAVSPELLARISAAAGISLPGPTTLVFRDPLEVATGALLALDAAAIRLRDDRQPVATIHCCGPDAVFAPMRPRSFRDYWSRRGFVRELEAAGGWSWEPPVPARPPPLRLAPALAGHLPDFWSDLAAGSGLLLSPGVPLPAACLLESLTPEGLATRLDELVQSTPEQRDATRRDLCTAVVRAHSPEHRGPRLQAVCQALRALAASGGHGPALGAASVLLLDRTRPLRELATTIVRPVAPPQPPGVRPGSLSAVVVCYEMGEWLAQTVHSVWSATRVPDEVLVVDDGSADESTRQVLARLQQESAQGRGPLTLLRQSNRGLAAARNAGLAAASGEFISFLDGDDLIEPRFYGLALDLLQSEPRLGGVAAWAELFGSDVPHGFWNAPQPELPLLLVENTVFVPCLMRTALLRELGGYDSGQRFNYEDWELSIRMLASGWPIVTLPLYLQQYRVRGDSLLRTMTEVQNQMMRERLLARHRRLVDRFAVETAMLVEYELMRRLHRPVAQVARQRGPWRTLRAAWRSWRGDGGSEP
jgi:hypothetical protein